jgi:hypothetical protein
MMADLLWDLRRILAEKAGLPTAGAIDRAIRRKPLAFAAALGMLGCNNSKNNPHAQTDSCRDQPVAGGMRGGPSRPCLAVTGGRGRIGRA